MYAGVLFPLPLRKVFTYVIPPALQNKIQIGQQVLAPFQRQILSGFVVSLFPQSEIEKTKPLQDILDLQPVFSPRILKLTRWLSDYYFCSWGEALKAAIPAELQVKSQLWVKKIDSASPLDNLNSAQKKLLEILSDHKPVRASSLAKRAGFKGVFAELYNLESKGIVKLEYLVSSSAKVKLEKIIRLKSFPPAQELNSRQFKILEFLKEKGGILTQTELRPQLGGSNSVLKQLQQKNLIEIFSSEKFRDPWEGFKFTPKRVNLNSEQLQALNKVKSALERNKFQPFLLYGVTGSGKTEIYIEAIQEVLKHKKQALVLVPEISLTIPTIMRFKAVFGNQVISLHSGLSTGERFDAWRKIQEGKFPVVIGARSTVFAPLENLGLIVVDEEQDASYKQTDSSPRYNARDTAVMRGKIENVPVILGSATPSVESFHNALKGKYVLLGLSKRVEEKPMAVVKIIDLKKERENKNYDYLTGELKQKIQEKLSGQEQAILFLNRRGFSTFVKCQDCGFIATCRNCNITLTYHLTDLSLRCHYCSHTEKAPGICPACNGNRLLYKGVGTQRVESEIKKAFGESSVRRLDSDVSGRKNLPRQVLMDFGEKKFPILLGTQMVTKGFDFPNVTLVGVVSADVLLELPDFRAKERTFQVLTQVAGRAGRGDIPGEVILQTYYPNDWAIKLAGEQDFKKFYFEEIKSREDLFYPPFSHLILILFLGEDEKRTLSVADKLSLALKERIGKLSLNENIILGPAPAPLEKLKRNYRYQVVVKTKKVREVVKILEEVLEGKEFKSKKVRVVVDVDPAGMM